jgi:hypothetical protein
MLYLIGVLFVTMQKSIKTIKNHDFNLVELQVEASDKEQDSATIQPIQDEVHDSIELAIYI